MLWCTLYLRFRRYLAGPPWQRVGLDRTPGRGPNPHSKMPIMPCHGMGQKQFKNNSWKCFWCLGWANNNSKTVPGSVFDAWDAPSPGAAIPIPPQAWCGHSNPAPGAQGPMWRLLPFQSRPKSAWGALGPYGALGPTSRALSPALVKNMLPQSVS